MSKTSDFSGPPIGKPPRQVSIPRARKGALRGTGFADGLRALGMDSLGGEPLNLAATEIGERIRWARHGVGLTQGQLAKKAGIGQGDLSDIELGKGRDGPSYRMLKTLAKALDIALPINPYAEPEAQVTVIQAKGENNVRGSTMPYEAVQPLLSIEEWSQMARTVTEVLPVHTGALRGACHLFNVGPSAHVRFRTGDGLIVITQVRGGGRVRMHGALHRFNNVPIGAPMAILDSSSEVEVRTSPDETFAFMMLPAGALISSDE